MLTSVAKCGEGLRNKVSTIIRRYIDHTGFAPYMTVLFLTFFSYSFASILCHCIYRSRFCMLLFNFVQLSLMYSYCYVCSVLGILHLCFVLCIVCV